MTFVTIILMIAVAVCFYLAKYGPISWQKDARIVGWVLVPVLAIVAALALLMEIDEIRTYRERIHQAEQTCMKWGERHLRREPVTVADFEADMRSDAAILRECQIALGRVQP